VSGAGLPKRGKSLEAASRMKIVRSIKINFDMPISASVWRAGKKDFRKYE
jgi:hypothetical protein